MVTFKQYSEGGSGGGFGATFVRLKDGESISGVFAGEPAAFYQHWDTGNHSTLCAGEGCELCAAGERKSFRFRICFITKENGKMVVKVFEQGIRVYNMLKTLNVDYPLDKWMVKISRTGSGKDNTTYNVMPLPNGELNEAQSEAVASMDLPDIDPSARRQEPARRVESNDVPF